MYFEWLSAILARISYHPVIMRKNSSGEIGIAQAECAKSPVVTKVMTSLRYLGKP